MKTKLTFLSIAIAALLGVGMLMAFKQEENKKKYLILRFLPMFNSKYNVIQIDENGVISNEVLKREFVKNDPSINDMAVENEIINTLSSKGYSLIEFKGEKYYFEKQ